MAFLKKDSNCLKTACLRNGKKLIYLPNLRKTLYLKKNIIAKQSLHIKELRKAFEHSNEISVQDLIQFYHGYEKDIRRATVDWRIYELKKENVLHRIARGVYSLSRANSYIPEITRSQKLLFSSIKKQFPFVELCIWNTKWLNEFMLHQPGRFYTIIEIERDVMESVFYELKEQGKDVYLDPSEDVMDKYIVRKKDPIIITNLTTEAPLQTINKVSTATLEKMLVDIVSNEILFAAQQGAELKRIYNSAIEKYTISNTKLLRYAGRRNRKSAIERLINELQRNGNKM